MKKGKKPHVVKPGHQGQYNNSYALTLLHYIICDLYTIF